MAELGRLGATSLCRVPCLGQLQIVGAIFILFFLKRTNRDLCRSGPNSTFGGTITVTVPYNLMEGHDRDGIVVYHVSDDGTIERALCIYSEGYVTFYTDHFSVYAVMYEGPTGDGSLPTSVVVAIAGIVMILAMSAFMLNRRM